MVEHDGDNKGEMLASGLISPRTDLVLPHKGHVPEQLEGTSRGRVVLMLKDDVDTSLFAVLREAPEDDVRDGFLQPRRYEALPCWFQTGDLQGFVHFPRQELPEKVSHGSGIREVFSGDQIVRVVHFFCAHGGRVRQKVTVGNSVSNAGGISSSSNGSFKNFGAVLVKTNVLLVLPNKLAKLGAVYDCLH